MRMNGGTDVAKLIVGFRNFTSAPNNLCKTEDRVKCHGWLSRTSVLYPGGPSTKCHPVGWLYSVTSLFPLTAFSFIVP